MPKSRGRKRKRPLSSSSTSGVVKMSPELHSALLQQRAAFRAKFGRDPGPGDPIFFDPDADTPVPISPDRMERELDEAARKAGLDPAALASLKKLLR
jgi:hypothetical protein